MQDEEEKIETKSPIEMTSDELLDYVVAPEVAEKLRERLQEQPCEPEESD